MKFIINTLGCKVNTYESNVMRDLLVNEGYCEAKENEQVDIAIINTCSVTNTSDSKSLKLIRRVIKENEDAIIIVTGCYAQVNEDVLSKMEGVDIVLGNHEKSKIVSLINEYKKTNKKIVKLYDISKVPFDSIKLNNFNKTRAFVKIEDGCENFCSYCIIPYTRGKVRSKDMEDVIDEVKCLVNNGHHEIVLTGIHTGHYGSDKKEYDFSDLLSNLCKIVGLERLRISSIEITELNDKFLKVLKENPKIVDHLHIPLQSGCNKTLKDMNRKYDVEYFENKIEKIRKIRPNISITTDLIVGFNDESLDDFETTLKTIERIKFAKIHVFPFSLRKGTKAEEMKNPVDEVIKKERVKKVLEISKKLEIEYMKKFVNKDVIFIPEVKKDGYLIGHTGNYLLVKLKTDMELSHEKVKCKLESVNYPYVMSSLFDTKKQI